MRREVTRKNNEWSKLIIVDNTHSVYLLLSHRLFTFQTGKSAVFCGNNNVMTS